MNNLSKTGVVENILNLIKNIYKTFAARITLNSDVLNFFFLISGIKQGCVFSPQLFNIVLEVPSVYVVNAGGFTGLARLLLYAKPVLLFYNGHCHHRNLILKKRPIFI